MKVKILSLSKKLFEGEAKSLTLPAVDGEITLLPQHMPILTQLKKGKIIVRPADSSDFVEIKINSGTCHCANNISTIVLD